MELAADVECDSVVQKLVDDPAIDIDVQHNEEMHHTPTNDRRETAEARATQLAGILVAERHAKTRDRRLRKKCGNVSTRPSPFHMTSIRSCRTRLMNERKTSNISRMQSSL